MLRSGDTSLTLSTPMRHRAVHSLGQRARDSTPYNLSGPSVIADWEVRSRTTAVRLPLKPHLSWLATPCTVHGGSLFRLGSILGVAGPPPHVGTLSGPKLFSKLRPLCLCQRQLGRRHRSPQQETCGEVSIVGELGQVEEFGSE